MKEENTKRQGIRNLIVMLLIVTILSSFRYLMRDLGTTLQEDDKQETVEDALGKDSTEIHIRGTLDDFDAYRLRLKLVQQQVTSDFNTYKPIELGNGYTMEGFCKPDFYTMKELKKIAKQNGIASNCNVIEHYKEDHSYIDVVHELSGALELRHYKVSKATRFKGSCTQQCSGDDLGQVFICNGQKVYLLPVDSRFEVEVSEGEIYIGVIGNNITAGIMTEVEENQDLELVEP